MSKDEGINFLIFPPDNNRYPFKFDDFILDFNSEPLGTGGQSSVVRLGQHKPTQQRMAIKFVDKSKLKQEAKNFRELSKCKNIIDFYGLCMYNHQAWICMELMALSLKDLYTLIHGVKDPFPEELMGNIAVSLINALSFCESKRILHRDVKPHNVLISFKGYIKLADFGVARTIAESSINSTHGTIAYWPPERFDSTKLSYDGRADVWSQGITLLECVAGHLPYLDGELLPIGEPYIMIQTAIVKLKPQNIIEKFLANYSVTARNFAQRCLAEVNARPHIEDLKDDQFYSENKNIGNQYVNSVLIRYWAVNGLKCNECILDIGGSFYRCLICEDYDVCRRCVHKHPPEHPMLRYTSQKLKVPTPSKINLCQHRIREIQGHLSCDYCHVYLYGTRFSCIECNEYDLCKWCEHRDRHPQHVLLRKNMKISNKKMIHKNIMCNRCEMEEIAGNRYKCLLCDRYNMCQRCFSKEDHPHQECFLRLAYPLPQEEIHHLLETVVSLAKDGNLNLDSNDGSIKCDLCKKSLKVVRYRCVQCVYNLCEDCELKQTHIDHAMIRIKTPEEVEQIKQSVSSNNKASSSNPSQATSNPNNVLNPKVHEGILCDGCRRHNFPGNRYKCLSRDDYDLCETCLAKEEHVHQSYFLRIATPLSNEQEQMEILMKNFQSLDNKGHLNKHLNNGSLNCSLCQQPIKLVRYCCAECVGNLCQSCESKHTVHAMIRIKAKPEEVMVRNQPAQLVSNNQNRVASNQNNGEQNVVFFMYHEEVRVRPNPRPNLSLLDLLRLLEDS